MAARLSRSLAWFFQRYAYVSGEPERRTVRFSSGAFSAEIVFDADGFVRHYPGLATPFTGRDA